MLRTTPFPLKQSELNEYFQDAVEHLQNNSPRFGLADSQISNLKHQLEEWQAAYVMYKTSLNKNKAVYRLSMAMEALQSELKKIYLNLNRSALTELDIYVLNLGNFWTECEMSRFI